MLMPYLYVFIGIPASKKHRAEDLAKKDTTSFSLTRYELRHRAKASLPIKKKKAQKNSATFNVTKNKRYDRARRIGSY